MKKVTTRDTVPCAFVTKGKQRIKQFDNTVYLYNGDEFEIELFNPTTNKVLAQIELNGKSIGAGIVLRPGERVFLERYIETARKFLFETYKVNGKNEEVKEAIANNGNVSVKFYAEYIYPLPYYRTYTVPSVDWNYYGYSSGGNGIVYGNNATLDCCNFSDNSNIGTASYKSTPTGPSTSIAGASASCFSSSVNYSYISPGVYAMEKDETIETGMIEKGSASNQTFKYDDTRFNTYWTWASEWKILPKSQKPVTSEDLNALYCGNCGARKGKGNFCQHCGSNHWIAK